MTSTAEAEIKGYLLNAPNLSDESRLLRGWAGQLESEELIQAVQLLQRYNKQREKCLKNIRKILEQHESRSNDPVQKARKVESSIMARNLSVELECLINIFKREPCLDQIALLDTITDETTKAEPRLIKLIEREEVQAEETVCMETSTTEDTITDLIHTRSETPKLTKPISYQSTIQKQNAHMKLDEPMMSPIITAPKFRLESLESGECSDSDSQEIAVTIPKKVPPKTRQPPRLMKSNSDSALGTPKHKIPGLSAGLKKRSAQVLTPRGNERKKQRSKELQPEEKRPGRGRPPKTNAATRARGPSSTRSASRSPSSMAKSKSLFDLKNSLFTDSAQKSSLFDGTPKKKSVKEKREEFQERQRLAEERQKQKKEEMEAERKRKAQEKEEKRARVKARQEQKEREQQEKLAKMEEKRTVPKKAGKSKLQRQRELAEEKAKQAQKVRELEEAAKQARIEEEERMRAAQTKKLPTPVEASDPSEETIIVVKNPLRDLGQQSITSTPTGKLNQKITDSYEITPRGCDKPNKSTADDYNIDDLSSGDETDDDENPKKAIPQWAQKGRLMMTLKNQYKNNVVAEDVFEGIYAHETRLVDLDEVFGSMVKPTRRGRLKCRETAAWQPMVEPRQLLDRTLNLDVSCYPGEEPQPIRK